MAKWNGSRSRSLRHPRPPLSKHTQAARNSFLIRVKIASARSRLPRARVIIFSARAREMPCFRAKLLTSYEPATSLRNRLRRYGLLPNIRFSFALGHEFRTPLWGFLLQWSSRQRAIVPIRRLGDLLRVTVMSPKCARCDDTFWVCEAHSRLPSDFGPSPRACQCRAPGMPCPDCNRSDPPRMPPGFNGPIDDKGPRN